ncbi:MAG TPA: molybdopterin cofactor-binding domain-containing protein [Pirellulales bacterium]|jgi:isoquinoline 1-oxidoreductase|nr:molybdopterin cofactor-binding domain-containing protein [Pirellulales bacterium]
MSTVALPENKTAAKESTTHNLPSLTESSAHNGPQHPHSNPLPEGEGVSIVAVPDPVSLAYDEPVDRIEFNFGVDRRRVLQTLGAGLLIAVTEPLWAQVNEEDALRREAAQRKGGGKGGVRGGGQPKVAARLHIGADGKVTLLTGKVECGQGSRTEFTEAAAEELRLPVSAITLVMADTALVPNDGLTAGSGSTPNTVPSIRRAAAATRQILIGLAAKGWNVEPSEVEVRDGRVIHTASNRDATYADLASSADAAKAFDDVPAQVEVTPVKSWKVMGVPTPRPNREELVNGKHVYPSDITRPGMLYGKVLRAPSFGLQSKPAKLKSVDLNVAKAMDGVVVTKDGDFVGVAAPTTFRANQALEAIAATAEWEHPSHPDSDQLFEHLEKTARGGVSKNPNADEMAAAAKTVKQDYHVAYIQHCPMEPRSQVAEWEGDKLTVWTASQNPFGVQGELARAFSIPQEKVRVIVPDFGGGFGGKHSGESAIEAARLAKEAGKPVLLHWTRAEEFTWAYFRAAALVKAEASLDSDGNITSWYFVNINPPERSAVDPPYRVGKKFAQMQAAAAPLRHGSYRALSATGNTFARESLMDELAEAAGKDPLEFRLAHLDDPRLRAVLQEATSRFDWTTRRGKNVENVGIGLACGTDKNSVVAACAEVEVDPKSGQISVRHVCEVFEAGAIINPENLRTQVMGGVIMGIGAALREEMKFADGKMLNAAFSKYLVPRFDDVPELDIVLLDKPLPGRPDAPSAGAGETPIIAVAPAIANAVFHATGQRIRQMPIKLTATT